MKIYTMKFKQGGKPNFRAFSSKELAEKELLKAKQSIIKEELQEWFELEQEVQQLEINTPDQLAQLLNDWTRYGLLRIRQ